MQEPRFGKLTDGLFYLFIMSVAAAIGLFAFESYPALKVFATFAWVLICVFYVYPWFFPVATKKYSWKSENSILVAFDSAPILLERNGKKIGLAPRIQEDKKSIWVYDYFMGSDAHLDGVDRNMVWLNYGKISAKCTPEGFLISWNIAEDPWKVIGEKSS